MMVLPCEIVDGIHITGMNYTFLICVCYIYVLVSLLCDFIEYIFTIPGVTSLLSCKINKDLIETFLGCKDSLEGAIKILIY